MHFMFWVWLGVIIVTAVLEFITLDLTSIWFTVGAIVPLILSIVEAVGWEWQVVIFVVLSLVLIFSLRKVTKKFLLRNAKEKTNLDSVIGKSFKLLSAIDDDGIGTIKVNGVVWNVVSADGTQVEKDAKVKIVKVEGSKFVVEKLNDENVVKEDK